MASVGGAALRVIATVAIANLAVASLGLRVCAADTLDWALAQAYQNNPTLNAQRAAARAQDEGVPQALSGYRPRATLTATVAAQNQSLLTRSAAGYSESNSQFTPHTVGVTVTQTLFNGYQTANRTRQAEAQVSAGRATLAVTEESILLQAATAYMNLLRDGAILDLQRRNVEVLQEQLRQTRDRFNVGEVTRTDVAQSESRLSQGRATVLSAESQYARSRANYRQFVGVEAGVLQPGAPVDRLTPRRLIESIEIARARHPSVGVAMFGIDTAVLQVKITEGSLYPQARLIGTVQQNWETNVTTQLQQFSAFVAAQVTIPIFNAGPTGATDTYSSIRAAKETVGQKRMDLDAQRDQVQANVVTAWGQLEASKAQILATNAQVVSAEIALNGVREEARVGQRTTLDVLNAQQELVNARTASVTAQHDRVVASYSLLGAVGELNLPKLGINIPLYDPMVHYQQVRDAWIGVRTPDGR